MSVFIVPLHIHFIKFIKFIYQETSLSMSFICSCIKAFLVLTTTKNKNVEIIQCLQFTFCTDTWWRQFNICTVTCAVFVLSLGSHISWQKQFSVVKTAIKREYRRFNYFAVLGPIYSHLVSFAPYHDLLSETDTGWKQSLFTMLLHFHNILEVLCLSIVGFYRKLIYHNIKVKP